MKVLFVGLGSIGQRHLRNLIQLENDVQVYAIRKRRKQFILDADQRIAENENLEEKYDIRVIDTVQEAKKEGVSTVFICNPTGLHMQYLREAIRCHMDVFVEKPISNHLEGISQLIEEAKSYGCITMVGYQNRFHPCIKETRRILTDRELGDICSIHAVIGENIMDWHPYEDYRKSYAARSELGGGVILSQIHELDYLCHMIGIPESVYAVGGKLSDLDIDVEDVADILMKYHIYDRKIPVHVHADYLQRPPKRSCHILCSRGKLRFDLLRSEIEIFGQSGESTKKQFALERNDLFTDEISDFLSSVKSRTESSIPLQEGLASLRIAIAVKDSLKKCKVIKVNGT